MDPLLAHQRAQDAFAHVLANVRDDQLDSATPCSEWTIRDLLDHVIGGNHRVAGSEASLTEGDARALVEAHAVSAHAAQDMFAAPGSMARVFKASFGEIPGSAMVGLRAADAFTHAWDLARATTQSTDLDAELANEVLAASRARFSPELRGPGRPFAEEQPCDDGRPAADRLAAFLGRSVT